MNITKLVGGGLVALVLAAACGGMSTQAGGSNTNWFASCNSSAECDSGLDCWCGICTKACATECSSGPAAATCSEPPAACTDPSKKSACAVQCAKDADCKDVASDATCVNSVCAKTNHKTEHDAGGATLTCDQRTSQAFDRLTPLEKSADEACATTADCVDFPSPSCTNGCSKGVISKTGLAAIQSSLDAIESDVCSPFKDAGCTVLEPPCAFPGFPACVDGKCTQRVGGPVDSGAPSSCDDRLQAIGDRLNAELGMADSSCTANEDCTRIGAADKCWAGCPASVVNKSAAAAFANNRAAVDRDLCDQFLSDGCAPATSFSCPNIPATLPSCVRGQCTDVGIADAGSSRESCSQQTDEFNTAIYDVVARADTKCGADRECKVTMLSNSCVESCTYVPASVDGAKSIQGVLDTMDNAPQCNAFKDNGCPLPRLPCAAPPTPVCDAGVCVLP